MNFLSVTVGVLSLFILLDESPVVCGIVIAVKETINNLVMNVYRVRQFHQVMQPTRYKFMDYRRIYYLTSLTCFGLHSHLHGYYLLL